MKVKDKIIFFARDYQSQLFPLIKSDKFTSVFVTLTKKEKKELTIKGEEVKYCYEEFIDSYEDDSEDDQLQELDTSFYSDRFYGKLNQSTRNHLLNCEISFWEDIFEEYRPIAVVNEVIAIEISEVMQILAKKNNIEYLAWMVSPFENRNFYWLSNPYHASLNKNIFDKEATQNSVTIAENYLNEIDVNYKQPFYARDLNNRVSFKKAAWIIKSIFVSIWAFILTSWQHHEYLKNFYNGSVEELSKNINDLRLFTSYFFSKKQYSKVISIKEEIVFYPLHYEPEASITYFSEFNENQISFIRNISKLISRNQCLVIKEHPQQPGILLSKEYRNLRKRLSNIHYLPAEYPTNQLIKVSSLIITQTSTAGWEALMYQKPVVVFGKVFYDKHPEINNFDGNWENLRIKIRNGELNKASKNANIKFVSNLWEYCCEGNPYPHKGLYSKSNINKIINAIEVKLNLI